MLTAIKVATVVTLLLVVRVEALAVPAPPYRPSYRPAPGRYFVLFDDETLTVTLRKSGLCESVRERTGKQWHGRWKWENRKLKVYEWEAVTVVPYGSNFEGHLTREWSAAFYTSTSFTGKITSPPRRK